MAAHLPILGINMMAHTRTGLVVGLSLLGCINISSELDICRSHGDCATCELCEGGRCEVVADLLNTCGECAAEPAEVCYDRQDNDCDGQVDEDCPVTACTDDTDNDGDGLTDLDDPGCADPADNNEQSAAHCDDGIDNDSDGLVDTDDPGCDDPADTSELGLAHCDDGVDNDGDGRPDLADPECSHPSGTTESAGPVTIESTSQSVPSVWRGKPITLGVVAVDPDDSPIQYDWQAVRGTFSSPTTEAQATWVAPVDSWCEHTVSVKVTDGEGSYAHHDFAISVCGIWGPANMHPVESEWIPTVAMHDGYIYVNGATEGPAYFTHRFDPTTSSWNTDVPPLPCGPDHLISYQGALHGICLGNAPHYSLQTDAAAWVLETNDTHDISEGTAAVLSDGLYQFGGYNVSESVDTVARMTTPGTWQDLARMPRGVTYPTTAVVGNDVYVMGGRVIAGVSYSDNLAVDLYRDESWHPDHSQLPDGVNLFLTDQAAVIGDVIFLFEPNQTHAYHTSTNTWEALGPSPNASGSGVVVDDNTIYVINMVALYAWTPPSE